MGLMVWETIFIYDTNDKKNVRILNIIDYYIILVFWILHYVDCFTIYSSTFISYVLYAYFNFRILVVSFHGVRSTLCCDALDDYRRIKYYHNNVDNAWSVRNSTHDTRITNMNCYLCFLEEVHYTLIFLSCIIYFN